MSQRRWYQSVGDFACRCKGDPSKEAVKLHSMERSDDDDGGGGVGGRSAPSEPCFESDLKILRFRQLQAVRCSESNTRMTVDAAAATTSPSLPSSGVGLDVKKARLAVVKARTSAFLETPRELPSPSVSSGPRASGRISISTVLSRSPTEARVSYMRASSAVDVLSASVAGTDIEDRLHRLDILV